jgi:histidinol phosphatase-like PHP family hydrolase
MAYVSDHDYHLHSYLSSCSNDPEQTVEALLSYAKANGLTRICLTDHFWDADVPGASGWYVPQDYAHIAKALPLPKDPQVEFYFGCETDMDAKLNIGIAPDKFDLFDFVIIPTTHLHMGAFTVPPDIATVAERARWYVKRLDVLLTMDLPFHKIGLAHMTCPLIYKDHWDYHLQVLDTISDSEYNELFAKSAEKGLGIELNFTVASYSEVDLERVLRPYKLAKAQGCRFYFGSDAHHPAGLEKAMDNFNEISRLLALEKEHIFDFRQN